MGALVALGLAEAQAYVGRTGPLAVHLAAVVLLGIAVLLRRRSERATWLLAAAAVGGQLAFGFAGVAAELLLYLAVVVIAVQGREPLRAVGVLGAVYLLEMLSDPSIRTLEQSLPSLAFFGAAVGLGVDLRRRSAAAQARLADERTRLARELHDVVTHSLSVVVVQAGAARLDAPPEQARAFALVEDTARSALVEMRRLLGVLRGDPRATVAPQPGLGQLPALVEQVRAAGPAVEVVHDGEPVALAPGPDRTAYRVLQEALTNVLTHAAASRVVVTLRWRPAVLAIEVVDDGAGRSARRGGGHGLVGMRERVAVYGGTVAAGPAEPGGWRVLAVLPLAPELVAP